MGFPALDLTPVQQLCDQLTAAQVPAAQDPAKVRPPGAWVKLEGINTSTTLGGSHELQVAVWLVAQDRDHRRAAESLALLYTLMLGVLTPDGLVTTEGLVLPANPTALPALRVPVNINT